MLKDAVPRLKPIKKKVIATGRSPFFISWLYEHHISKYIVNLIYQSLHKII